MQIITIIAINLIVYWRTLKYYLIVDDMQWYKYMNSAKPPDGNWITNFSQHVIFYVKYKFYGGRSFTNKPKYDHALTLGMHTSLCVFIYYAFGSNDVSFWTAMLYSVNPLNNQTSVWLNGRRYLVNIILTVLMVWLGSWALMLYPATMLFHVTAFFAPVLFLWEHPSALAWCLAVLPFILPELRKKIIVRLKTMHDPQRRTFDLGRLIIIVKWYGHYFFKMPFPGLCMFIYPTLHFWGLTEKGTKDAVKLDLVFARGVLSIITTASVMWFLLSTGQNKLACWWAFMVLATLQWSCLIPVTQDLSDRYASLPNVFMMFFLAWGVTTYIPTHADVILSCFLAVYIVLTMIVLRMYPNIAAFWEYHRFFNPSVPSPRKYEIGHYMRMKEYLRAWVLIQDGLRYNPDDFHYLSQAARCCAVFNQPEKCREFLEKAMQNYYIGQKDLQEPELKKLLDSIPKPQPESRQARRARERSEEKNSRPEA